MSYIRCLSNPEGLYIYGSDKGIVIYHCIDAPLASKGHFPTVPEKDFKRVGLRWLEGNYHDGAVRSGRLTVVEKHIYLDTGKPVGKDWFRGVLENPANDRPTATLVRFSYGRHFFYMWRVTWEYIARGIRGHVQWEKDVEQVPLIKRRRKS